MTEDEIRPCCRHIETTSFFSPLKNGYDFGRDEIRAREPIFFSVE